jgi:hypothetical protein
MTVVDAKSWTPQGLLQYNTDNNSVKEFHHIPGDSTSLASDSVFFNIQRFERPFMV